MDALLDELLDTLDCEADLYGSLVSVLEKEGRAIINAALEQLNEANYEKEIIILKIQKLEEDRIHILSQLSGLPGFQDQELTLERLTQLTPEPYSFRFIRCRSDLLSLTKTLRKKNNHNMYLLRHSIDFVRSYMELLNNMAITDKVYYRTGKIQPSNQNGRVVSGAI